MANPKHKYVVSTLGSPHGAKHLFKVKALTKAEAGGVEDAYEPCTETNRVRLEDAPALELVAGLLNASKEDATTPAEEEAAAREAAASRRKEAAKEARASA